MEFGAVNKVKAHARIATITPQAIAQLHSKAAIMRHNAVIGKQVG